MSQQVRLVSDRACPGRLLLLRLPDEDHHTDVRIVRERLVFYVLFGFPKTRFHRTFFKPSCQKVVIEKFRPNLHSILRNGFTASLSDQDKWVQYTTINVLQTIN